MLHFQQIFYCSHLITFLLTNKQPICRSNTRPLTQIYSIHITDKCHTNTNAITWNQIKRYQPQFQQKHLDVVRQTSFNSFLQLHFKSPNELVIMSSVHLYVSTASLTKFLMSYLDYDHNMYAFDVQARIFVQTKWLPDYYVLFVNCRVLQMYIYSCVLLASNKSVFRYRVSYFFVASLYESSVYSSFAEKFLFQQKASQSVS